MSIKSQTSHNQILVLSSINSKLLQITGSPLAHLKPDLLILVLWSKDKMRWHMSSVWLLVWHSWDTLEIVFRNLCYRGQCWICLLPGSSGCPLYLKTSSRLKWVPSKFICWNTHTHTHTHIYMFIYTYTFMCVSLYIVHIYLSIYLSLYLSVSYLLGRCSITWATPPAPFALVIFQIRSLPGASLRL
jgi:hypothetical protein